ncbi:MAG: SPOR domain-containing protein [Beijerinckiaceae bacterium]
MSASAERREPIDIEEFERRLRAPETAEPSRDPLADLARLVAGQGRPNPDPLESIFADAARREPQRPAPGASAEFGAAPSRPDLPDLSRMMRGGFGPGAQDGERLEPRFDARFDAPAPAVEAPHPQEFHPSGEYEDWAEEDSVPPDAREPAPPRARSRKPLILAGAAMLAGMAAIGATLAWRGGSTSPQGVTIIKAASGPTKVQPEGQAGSESAQTSTVLEKNSSAPAVKKVISRDEPPMDVAAADKTPRIIPLAGDTAPKPPAPPPPIQTTSPQPSAAPQVFPEPKKVKTVAVRADGTIISSDAKPAAAPPTLAAPPGARNSTPKSDTRAAATPAPPTMPITSPAPNAKPPAPPAPPKQVASAAPTPAPVAAAPKPAAPKPAAKPAPKPVAAAQEDASADDDTDNAPKPVASGGAAIQLAAAGSEAEARQAAQRLGEKFSSQLGGRRPSVVKAPDKAVWRVRVSGLSRESAVGACEKIKAAGGQCYVP